jgi:membrane fusion protein (multidrug efflux system)
MRVTLDRNLRQALVVQEEAIIPNGDKAFVLVAILEQGQYKAERREVVMGARRKGEVEILSGLILGERVVTHGGLKISDGSVITILAEENNNETLSELLQKPSADKSKSDEPEAEEVNDVDDQSATFKPRETDKDHARVDTPVTGLASR